MSNNRLWLMHRPTGNAICLGSRAAVGWELKPSTIVNLGSDLADFFDICSNNGVCTSEQDDFMLVLEDASGAPSTYQGAWQYQRLFGGGMRPLLTQKKDEQK